MTVVRYVLVKVQPGVSLDEFEKFEREVDYVKAAQNPSIVSYRTHRINDLDAGIDGGPWDFMERIEVTSQADYEKQAAIGQQGVPRPALHASSSTARRRSRSGRN